MFWQNLPGHNWAWFQSGGQVQVSFASLIPGTISYLGIYFTGHVFLILMTKVQKNNCDHINTFKNLCLENIYIMFLHIPLAKASLIRPSSVMKKWKRKKFVDKWSYVSLYFECFFHINCLCFYFFLQVFKSMHCNNLFLYKSGFCVLFKLSCWSWVSIIILYIFFIVLTFACFICKFFMCTF